MTLKRRVSIDILQRDKKVRIGNGFHNNIHVYFNFCYLHTIL